MLRDDDYMPFGVYKGFDLSEIPTAYFEAWYNVNSKRKHTFSVEEEEVYEYICKLLGKDGND